MAFRLVVLTGPDQDRSFPIPEDQILLLGRSRGTQTRLTDPQVSRVHCEVEADNGRVYVHDNDSSSGSFVNGRRVTRQELHRGDVIHIGNTDLRFESDGAEVAAPPMVFAARPGGGRPLPPALRRLQDLSGQTMGPYQLRDILGTGQVGVVFRGFNPNTQAVVAVKVFKPEFAGDVKAMKRLVRGVEAAGSLRHPHLVGLRGAGKADPYWWVAMELVEGESLAALLRPKRRPGPDDWRQALRVAVHISRALVFAHAHGIVHRNVMPANVLIRATDDVAKLSDLLLVKELEGSSFEVSSTGELVGNLFYMSPERTEGNTTVDGRSDVFSLGATVYHVLTGQLPFSGSTLPEVITQIRRARPTPPRQLQPSVPEGFDSAVLKMLAGRPEDRYPTAAAMLGDLTRLAKREAVSV
jgi:serine/threonine protein kinase